MSANSAIMSVFERWQIICYLCGGSGLDSRQAEAENVDIIDNSDVACPYIRQSDDKGD